MARTVWGDDESGQHKVGDRGFLVERSHCIKGWTRYGLYDRPAHTNMGGCPQFTGWCGTTDDVSVHAHGIGKVVRVARNGRVQFVQVEDPVEIEAVLDELGYPDIESDRG